MSDKKNNSAIPSTTNPYKTDQFDLFISTIKGNAVGHWVQVAKIVGVDRDTINEWRKLPQARKVIQDEIERVAGEMERAGKDDWKMWESKAKMLGLSPIEKNETDLTSGGEKVTPILGGISKDVSANDSDKETSESPEEN
jgi:hypothetical protein